MKITRSLLAAARLAGLLTLAATLSCADDAPPSGVEPSTDVGVDLAVDLGMDVHNDVGVDTEGDDADVAIDDVGLEDTAIEDVPSTEDAGADAPGDALEEDLGEPDTSVDATPDGATTDVAADAPTLEDDAVIVSVSFPASLACGEVGEATVVVRNTGTVTWNRDAGYKLGAVGDDDPFNSALRVWLDADDSVPFGSEHTFTVPLVAPNAPGVATTDWQMVHEGLRWFGESREVTVAVECDVLVDTTTLTGKLVMGYQGWFTCPGDGSPPDRWVHWFRNQDADAAAATVDMWPDISELDADELCPTAMTLPGGGPASVYSAYRGKTVWRHFGWMKDNNLDGVMLQRFSGPLADPAFFELRNQVARNVRDGAEEHGRTFAMMYDISGHNPDTLVEDIKADWTYVVDQLGVTGSERYLHHGGKPLLAIWGLGFTDRPGTAAEAAELIAWFKNDAPERLRVTLMGGVPTYWRTLSGDSKTDPAWASVYRSFDVVSPWAVGRYGDNDGADAFRRDLIAPDLAAAESAGIDYLPVVFPGFSWLNLHDGPLNQIPRRGGRFFWRQAYNAVDAGATMIYVAMFDEVNEATAMFKLAPTSAQLPVEGTFLPLDADGVTLPSDWYLKVADEAGRMLRGDIAVTETLPITP